MRQFSYINRIVAIGPFKEILFYFIIAVLLVFTAISFTDAFRVLILHREFTTRNTALYSDFKNLSTQVNNAAVLNPDLVRSSGYSKGIKLFYTDSISIIKQLDELKATAHDIKSVEIAGKLNTKIRAGLSWLLKSNVPDSIIHHRSAKHIAEFQIINILLDQGAERTFFLSKQQDKRLNDAIKSMQTWMIAFIVISDILFLYAVFNVFSQRAKSKKRFRADIIARKEIEESLIKSQKETSDYKYALDAGAIVSIVDHNGMTTYVNDNFCKISQFSSRELIGKNLRGIYANFLGQELMDNIWATITGGGNMAGRSKERSKGRHYILDPCYHGALSG